MEENKYKSKTMGMLEEKSTNLSGSKYSSFREELQKDLQTIKEKKDTSLDKTNQKPRFNEPEKKNKKEEYTV